MLVVAHAVLLPWAIRNARTLRPLHAVQPRRRCRDLHREQPRRHRRVVRLGRGSREAPPRRHRPRPRRHRRRRAGGGLAVDPEHPGRRRPALRSAARDRAEGRRVRRGVRHLREGNPAPRRADRRPARAPPARRPSPPRSRSPSHLRLLLAVAALGGFWLLFPRRARGSLARSRSRGGLPRGGALRPALLGRDGRQRPLSLGGRGRHRAARGMVPFASRAPRAHHPRSRNVFVRNTAIWPRVLLPSGQYTPAPQPPVMPWSASSSIQSAKGDGQATSEKTPSQGGGT